jgi:hypothetical protein
VIFNWFFLVGVAEVKGLVVKLWSSLVYLQVEVAW